MSQIDLVREELRNMYEAACNTPNDIYEHLPVLAHYSKDCNSIAEFGVRAICSTWAFLYALASSSSTTPKTLYCVDIDDVPNIHEVANKVATVGIDLKFFKNDSVTVTLPSDVDILFIDTWHVFAHLIRELENHHKKVRKYIFMHDTETDRIYGESVRLNMDTQKQAEETGYPVEEICAGLWPAIQLFLDRHRDEWVFEKAWVNNNGLTCLRRINNKSGFSRKLDRIL